MRYLQILFACICLTTVGAMEAQPDGHFRVNHTFQGKPLALGVALHDHKGDSFVLHTFRWYLGDVVFWKNGGAVFSENGRYHLLDLEDSVSLAWPIPPAAIGADSLSFSLGVDSATTRSGAMGGDLDPTKGMFWSWQSGYINVKLEGTASQSTARGKTFELHLGGYWPPFQAAQPVGLPIGKANGAKNLALTLELAPLFEAVDWPQKPNIMSPGAEAVRLSKRLALSFNVRSGVY